MHRFWRAFYAVVESAPVVALAVLLLRVVAALWGPDAAHRLIGIFGDRFVWSGWPVQRQSWVNLHLSRWSWRVRRRAARARPRPQRAPRDTSTLRIGIYGPLSGALNYPRELFLGFPRDRHALHVYDLEYLGRHMAWLSTVATEYRVFRDEAGTPEAVACHAADAQLDLFLIVRAREDAYVLADALDTPCIAHVSATADLLHHDKLAFQVHCNPEPDYFVRDARMFCGTTRVPFSDAVVHDGWTFIGARGLPLQRGRTFAERDPLIAYHGSLYKLATPALLDVLFRLMAEDAALQLAFMGKDAHDALARITAAAQRAGVASRVHYEGRFSAVANADGIIDDPGWQKMTALLSRARLYPDPWPITSGNARYEAYASGVPVAHLAVRFDEGSWGKRQPVTIDVPFLSVAAGTAPTIDAYAETARRCLQDAPFADALAEAQIARARQLADAGAWWQQVLGHHETWRRGR